MRPGPARKTPNATVFASPGIGTVTSCLVQPAWFAMVTTWFLGSARAASAVNGPRTSCARITRRKSPVRPVVPGARNRPRNVTTVPR